MDQDVGSSAITSFFKHPGIICVGAEADDFKLSGYIYIHKRPHMRHYTTFRQKYKNSLYNQNSIVFTIQIHVTRTWYSSSTEPLLNGHLLGLLQNSARPGPGLPPGLGCNSGGLHPCLVRLNTGKSHPCTLHACRPLHSVDMRHNTKELLHQAK